MAPAGDGGEEAGRAVLARASREAPPAPGVYFFLGAGDEVLYVGKAARHATWREADLIFALAPPFNANPGLRSRDPLGAVARPPFLEVTEVSSDSLRFALDPDPSGAGRIYGCFPHLGRGVASQLGIACSDGYAALLRLLWAASGEGSNVPALITRSAPPSFEVSVAIELRAGVHRLLSGVSPRVLDGLAQHACRRPDFMQPALVRDALAAARFFEAGPRRVREHRLRQGLEAAPVDADSYRRLLVGQVEPLLASQPGAPPGGDGGGQGLRPDARRRRGGGTGGSGAAWLSQW